MQNEECITRLATAVAEKTRENDVLRRRVGGLEIRGIKRLDPPAFEGIQHSLKKYLTHKTFLFRLQRGSQIACGRGSSDIII